MQYMIRFNDPDNDTGGDPAYRAHYGAMSSRRVVRFLNYRSKIMAGAARIPTRAGECAVLCPVDVVKSEAVTTNTCLREVTSTSTPQHSASSLSRRLRQMTFRSSCTLCATVRRPLFPNSFRCWYG